MYNLLASCASYSIAHQPFFELEGDREREGGREGGREEGRGRE